MDLLSEWKHWPPNGSQFSFFFKKFAYNFFLYYKIVTKFFANHATPLTKTSHLLSAPILFSSAAVEQMSLKMKNGHHLDATVFTELQAS